jgi:hypothetical protein
MTANATLTLSMADYTKMQTDLAEARQDAAALRADLVVARLADPQDRVKKLTAFARECLTIARFGVANLPPEMIRRWPYDALRRVAENIEVLPDCDQNDKDMALDLISFAKDCEAHEIRRRAEPPPTPFTAEELEAERQRLAQNPIHQMMEAKRATPGT